MTSRRTHLRTCPLCEATCGLEITTEGDRVVRIRGDMNDPVSKGFICPKGSTLKQLHEDPDRLRAPVKRTEAGWVEIGWDEAYDEIAERTAAIVDEHGRQALGIVIGNPNVHNLGGGVYLRNVIQAVGSTNIFSASTVDQMPKHVSSGLLWGDAGMFPLPDLDRTDYLLMLGANPWASNGSLVTVPDFPGKLTAIQERGGRFVVVDPRVSRTAQEADEHLFIRPGTDVVLLLALANVLFTDDLVDLGRLADHIDGVDEVRAAVAPYTPEHAADVTGVPVDTIRRIGPRTRHGRASRRLRPDRGPHRRVRHARVLGDRSAQCAHRQPRRAGRDHVPVRFRRFGSETVNRAAAATRFGRWTGRASGRPERNGRAPGGQPSPPRF